MFQERSRVALLEMLGRLAVEKAAELAKGGMRPGRRSSSRWRWTSWPSAN